MEQKISETTILDLNDGCLAEICKYLSQRDQMAFALLCPRFKKVFKLHCKKEHSHFTTNEYWRRSLTEKYFQLAGSLIKHIDMDSDEQAIEDLVIKCCPNIEESQYYKKRFYQSSIDDLKNLVKNSKLLHSLTFNKCSFGDDVIQVITEIPTIDEVIIKFNPKMITGKYISRLEKLKILSLEECHGIETEYLGKISSKELHTLTLKNCNNVTAECLQNITTRFQNLKKLSFTSKVNDNQLMCKDLLLQLSGLKEIDVNECTDDFLKAIAENESDQLEKLTLTYEFKRRNGKILAYKDETRFDYRNIVTKYQNLKELTIQFYMKHIMIFVPLKCLENIYLTNCFVGDAGIIHMLEICPKLIYISVEKNQAVIKRKVLKEAIKMLSSREGRKGPVTLRLKITALTKDYLQTTQYWKNKLILQLELI